MGFEKECAKDKKIFHEKDCEVSHDIPRYIGGTDKDGRKWLCKKHHYDYDKDLLIELLKYVGETLDSDSDIPFWQIELSKQSEELKKKFREIAREFSKRFYG